MWAVEYMESPLHAPPVKKRGESLGSFDFSGTNILLFINIKLTQHSRHQKVL